MNKTKVGKFSNKTNVKSNCIKLKLNLLNELKEIKRKLDGRRKSRKNPLSLCRKEGRAVRRNIVYFRTVSEVRNKDITGEKD